MPAVPRLHFQFVGNDCQECKEAGFAVSGLFSRSEQRGCQL